MTLYAICIIINMTIIIKQTHTPSNPLLETQDHPSYNAEYKLKQRKMLRYSDWRRIFVLLVLNNSDLLGYIRGILQALYLLEHLTN